MRLCTKSQVLQLIRKGRIGVANAGNLDDLFLDDIRIGLRLRDEILEICGPVDLRTAENMPLENWLALEQAVLLPGRFYVALSQEKLCLPNNVLGLINTRSKYARFGLEMSRSSLMVAPGFGNGVPTSIVFEMAVPVEIRNLSPTDRYAYLILFELTRGVAERRHEYRKRFPLTQWPD